MVAVACGNVWWQWRVVMCGGSEWQRFLKALMAMVMASDRLHLLREGYVDSCVINTQVTCSAVIHTHRE